MKESALADTEKPTDSEFHLRKGGRRPTIFKEIVLPAERHGYS